MAHFAKLDENNIVIGVHVVHNNEVTDKFGQEDEELGVNFLKKIWGADTNWKQCSYNTLAGVHELGGTPFRKNYPGKGFQYDPAKDAFIDGSPYPSWIFDETSCTWKSPVPRPEEGKQDWDEASGTWKEVSRD